MINVMDNAGNYRSLFHRNSHVMGNAPWWPECFSLEPKGTEQWRHILVLLLSGSGKLYVEVCVIKGAFHFCRCIVIELARTDERPHNNVYVK